MISNQLKRRVDAASGRIGCDILLKDVNYLDVFSCSWKSGELAIIDGVIVGVEPGLRGDRVIDCRGWWVVPGFIDAHVHIESSLMRPEYFQQAVLPCGTTTVIADPHELANVMGVRGIEYFLNAADHSALDLWIMLSSCVPATQMETNGGGTIGAEALSLLSKHRRALGLAEMMNVPGVLSGDQDILSKLSCFSERPLDGHSPLLRGRELSAYASTGISSCHESSELEEAREKLSKGISIWIREGSVAKDLDALAPLMTLATSTSVGFCTDDRNPLDIESEGHIDYLIRRAIHLGIPMEVAYRSASWTPARHYGLASGMNRVGAVAPGYAADLVVLDDAKTCAIRDVMKKGRLVSELDWTESESNTKDFESSVRAYLPEPHELEGPSGRVHIMRVIPGKIITGRDVQNHDAEGVCRISVLERYGRGSKPANAYVHGFGTLKGAIASSVGHDSHNLIVVGGRTEDMRAALGALMECGGGFCVVENSKVIARLPLQIGGLMSTQDPKSVTLELKKLKAASQNIGCALPEPFLQLAFLSLPVIPSLKLTDRGLVDVDRFSIIDVRC